MQPINKYLMAIVFGAFVMLGTQVYAKVVQVDIPEQPLASALTKLAQQTHVQVLVSQELVVGKMAPTLKGTMEPNEAFASLLSQNGLEAVNQDGTIIVQRADETVVRSLEKITLTSTLLPREGSAETGYKVDTVKNIGPWGDKDLLDIPYSVNVMSSDLIQNNITTNTDQLFKMNPTTQLLQPFDMNGLTRVMLRGFLVQSAMMDGIQANTTGTGIFIENVDRIETLTGLSGFMYGVGNVGGTLNYVTKRPTETPMYELTMGNYGGEQYFAHADFGGPIDQNNKFSYRINLTGQDGDTVLNDQSLEKWLLSGALDWHPTDKLAVGFDLLHGYYNLEGRPAQWTFSSTLSELPSAPDSTATWASTDTFNRNETDRLGAKLTYDFNEMFSLRAGYNYQEEERRYIIQSATITSPTTYTLNQAFAGLYETKTTGGYAYVDVNIAPLGIDNTITIGINGYTSTIYDGSTLVDGVVQNRVGSSVTGLSLSDSGASNISLSDVQFDTDTSKSSEQSAENILIGDTIRFNDQWSTMVGLNHAKYTTESFTSGTRYNKAKTTPSLSLLYKPIENITTYATYIESLEQGATVTNTSSMIFTNEGTVFEPMKSTQYEIGGKIDLDNLLLTAALFRIEKFNRYNQDNGDGTYTASQNGEQVHQGVEMTVSGKVTPDLTLFGGLTFMDAEVNKSTNKSAEGKIPQGVAEQMTKIYAEYDLPFLDGLTLTGGLYYVGKSYINATNTQKAPAYTVADAGLRYKTTIEDMETTFRLLVTNLTDEEYWTSNYTIGAMVGAPRTVSFSMSMKF